MKRFLTYISVCLFVIALASCGGTNPGGLVDPGENDRIDEPQLGGTETTNPGPNKPSLGGTSTENPIPGTPGACLGGTETCNPQGLRGLAGKVELNDEAKEKVRELVDGVVSPTLSTRTQTSSIKEQLEDNELENIKIVVANSKGAIVHESNLNHDGSFQTLLSINQAYSVGLNFWGIFTLPIYVKNLQDSSSWYLTVNNGPQTLDMGNINFAGDTIRIENTLAIEEQNDADGDNIFNAVEVDSDNDGIANEDEPDTDRDGIIDDYDVTPIIHIKDRDGDGIGDLGDNCPNTPNLLQDDYDADNIGNLCDGDYQLLAFPPQENRDFLRNPRLPFRELPQRPHFNLDPAPNI